ncbi:carboxypeptidase family protein [Mucilaginibacter gracilis]|uniref:Carboxypeptidase family protein n=1 Tax=Mucilaginibacter gracilis TaxID=423350 RepID=A0A495J050_9SPHI|nr:carboxypeptidase regulatory-like domain-containing protein [Mucilaginibacter gracilis]RKR82340.1 carboxypeptidase family protein [Mucilaginibacter gracilis]
MRKHLLILFITVLTSVAAFAQVTTSSFSGIIKDSKGETLPGATIRATHTPSGSTYTSTTNIKGQFTLPGVRVGGPYTVVISYIGYEPQTFTGIVLKLGEPFLLNVTMNMTGTALKEVTISNKKEINVARVGASTNISSRMLQTLPTINRSVTDFTRLSPLANGNSFAGRDSRLNNIQVDGASLNNSFGLSTDPFPGGGAQPISIESYDEISVNAAPVDVRQSGFTGAGIYAVTKSGTNTFTGSAYGYYKNQSYNGTSIGDNDISSSFAKSSTKTYGFTLGGPIIKNRVFFFVNYENTKSTTPGLAYSPTNGSGIGTVSLATASDLQKVSDYLQSKYGYSTGAYDNYPAFAPANQNFLAKLDVNINDKNKLTLKYSNLSGTTDNQLNGTSIPNSANFTVTGKSGSVSSLPYARYSNQSLSFQNSNYGFINKVRTYTAELNSSITSKLSNQLLFAVTQTDTKRSFPGGDTFPTIDIFQNGSNYITAGNDPYTLNNDVINNTTSITDNLTFYAGKHTITGGASYDYQYLGNQFMQGAAGYYAYNSLDDFLNNRAPVYFAYTYSLTPGVSAPYSASLKVGTVGLYIQDEVAVNDNFKLTYGIRADKPIYLEDPPENPQISALQLLNKNGGTQSYNTGRWPSNHFLFSPRAGFRWNLADDKSLILRGGAGVFTGKTPYVYLTNMPTNSGMPQNGSNVSNATAAGQAILNQITLVRDPSTIAAQFPGSFPTSSGTTVPTSGAVVIDPNYKFPQVFRANLAVEKAFGDGYNLTLEGLYTKDINATRYINANLRAATGLTQEGDLSRERYVGTGTATVAATDRLIYPTLGNIYLLTNSSDGYTGAFTAQLSKSYANGFFGSIAYTYTVAKDVNANLGSTAASTYSGNPNIGTSNEEELGNSSFFTPHRVVANASYTIRYLNHGATTFGLYYSGSLGTPISYTINGDLNGDGNSNTDLMYIPKNVNDLTFVPTTATVNGVTYTYTAAQEAQALNQFINNSSYLSSHRGQYAQRNAAFVPWFNKVDLNFLQDVYIQTGKTRHTLQFSAVIQNFTNLLNKYWGVQQTTTFTNPVKFNGYVNNVPTYTYTNLNGKLVTNPYMDMTSNTTWSLLLGLKYKF